MAIKKFVQAASVAALTLGVAFVATPAQKASAQARGAGASSVTTLLRDNTSASGAGPVWNYANSFGAPFSYFVTGSGTGRNAFLNGSVDFVYTDGIGTTFGANTIVRNNSIYNTVTNAPVNDPVTGSPYVVVNEATLNVAFPFNVPGFDVSINGETACRILRGNTALGDPINWSNVVNSSGVRGPNLPIRRVARGDSSGTTDTLNGSTAPTTTTSFGFLQACNGLVPTGPGNGAPFYPAAPSFTGTGAIPDLRGPRVNNINDGTNIPNFNASKDIIVAAQASPLTSADHSNPTSYSLGLINTIRNTQGSIGYVETVLANANGFVQVGTPGYTTGRGLAVDTQALIPANSTTANVTVGTSSTVAVGPTFGIFRANYSNSGVLNSAVDACYGSIFSYLEGNSNPPGGGAGFNINNSGGAFPFITANSTEQGNETDNYGSYGVFNPNDFGACSRIGGFAPVNRTVNALLNSNGTLTFTAGVTPNPGDTINVFSSPFPSSIPTPVSSGSTFVFTGTVTSTTGRVTVYVDVANSTQTTYQFSGNTTPPTLYNF